METWQWFVVGALIAVALLAFVGVWWRVRRRRRHLRGRFGPEYGRVVAESGRRSGERHLAKVEREHEKLEIRPLPAATRERYRDEWHQAEVRFVSDPRDATRAAERIVMRVLEERGYPVEVESADQAAHVAADHPDVAERYRHAHGLLDKVDGNEGTESLRKAMLDFRAVFEEVLEAERTAA